MVMDRFTEHQLPIKDLPGWKPRAFVSGGQFLLVYLIAVLVPDSVLHYKPPHALLLFH